MPQTTPTSGRKNRKQVCLWVCLLAAAACGKSSTTTAPTSKSDVTVSATARTTGGISGATVTLNFRGNGAAAAPSGTDRPSQTTNAAGSSTFAGLDDGWYAVSIMWTVGTTTRNHGPLETHSGCLTAFLSNRTALAQCDAVKLPPSRTVSFVFDN